MVLRITFKGKRRSVANVSLMERHGERTTIRTNAAQHLATLTAKGKKDSFQHGEKLPKNLRLKTYFSPLLRTRQTAHHIYRGHVAAGGKAAKYRRVKRVGRRQELVMRSGINIFFNNDFVDKETKRLNNDWDALTKNWLDGKYPASKVYPAKKLAREIIRKRLLLGKRATRTGRKGWLILNVSHDIQILAVLSELLGKNPYKLGFKLPDYNKGLAIYHTPQGRDILEFGGQRFDVTKRLKEFAKLRRK